MGSNGLMPRMSNSSYNESGLAVLEKKQIIQSRQVDDQSNSVVQGKHCMASDVVLA